LKFSNLNPYNSIIISNDQFREYPSPKSPLKRWRIPAMIISSQFIIPGLISAIESILNSAESHQMKGSVAITAEET
ncbi:MAG: hypothetical protein ACTSXU_11060, partial [Promethearchaeota archaeon]